jgi:hypothetical protein
MSSETIDQHLDLRKNCCVSANIVFVSICRHGERKDTMHLKPEKNAKYGKKTAHVFWSPKGQTNRIDFDAEDMHILIFLLLF